MSTPEKGSKPFIISADNSEPRSYPKVIDLAFSFYGKIFSTLLRLKAEPVSQKLCEEEIRDVSKSALDNYKKAIQEFTQSNPENQNNTTFQKFVTEVSIIENIVTEFDKIILHKNPEILQNLHSAFFTAFGLLIEIIDNLDNNNDSLKQTLITIKIRLERLYNHLKSFLQI
ncbi:hypothetical protein ACFL21_03845 [Patescibacteria group bacterium]